MKVVVMYDISSDRARESLVAYLQKLGLTRVQRSVFVGRGNHQLVKDVERIANYYVKPDRDVVHIVLVDDGYWRRSKVVGTPYFARRSSGVSLVV